MVVPTALPGFLSLTCHFGLRAHCWRRRLAVDAADGPRGRAGREPTSQANRAILDQYAAAVANVGVGVLVELLHEDAASTSFG